VALIWSAIVVLAMVLMVGLSLDVGKLVLNNQELQNAADAAALAGALYVKTELPDFARGYARHIGLENTTEGLAVSLRTTPSPQEEPFPEDDSAYDIALGRWVRYSGTFLPTLDAPNAVKVIARRNAALAEIDAPPLRLIWGPIVGVDTADAARVAISFCNSSNGAGLIVLSDLPNQGMEIAGNAFINIDNGGIHVNSTAVGHNNHDGAWIHGTPVLDTGFINVVGGITPPPDDSDWEDIFAVTQDSGEPGAYPVLDYDDGIPHIDDPLAAGMLGPPPDPHIESTGTYAGMRLDMPALIQEATPEVPTQYARWNSSNSSYDLFDPIDPTGYMRWNGSGYARVEADPSFDDPSHFADTVGLAIRRDPVTGEPVLDPTTGQPYVDNPAVDVNMAPGYYPNGMRLSQGDDVSLDQSSPSGAGTFFIFGGGTGGTNVGLYVATGASLTGKGVTCFVTQNFDTGVPGVLRVTGGAINIDSPGDWTNDQNGFFDLLLVEGLNGIAIWQDPAMTPLPEAHLNGNGDFGISGTIYCPDPIHLRLEGNLGDTGNQVLCGTLEVAGRANISIDYDGRNGGNSESHVCLVY
jgi:hypothetical protein